MENFLIVAGVVFVIFLVIVGAGALRDLVTDQDQLKNH